MHSVTGHLGTRQDILLKAYSSLKGLSIYIGKYSCVTTDHVQYRGESGLEGVWFKEVLLFNNVWNSVTLGL